MTDTGTVDPLAFAADNHNVASNSDSFADYARFTGGAAAGALAGQLVIPIPIVGAAVGAVLGGALARQLDNPQKVVDYSVASVVSGAHSFYNTGVDLGNWMGANVERANTQETLSHLDSNLGEYYYQNKESVDLGGLILGSIIPGTIAVKVINWGSRALVAAKAGQFGLNIGEASGLLPTLSESLYAKAAMQLAEGTVASRINQSSVLALAAGVGEQALMIAGTEVLIASTMEANPTVENMTWKDHVVNTAVGTAFFAPIFAGIGALQGAALMKTAASRADIESMPWRHITHVDPKMGDSEALFFHYMDQKGIPAIPEAADGLSAPRIDQLTRYATDTSNKLNTLILGRWQKITGGDLELSQALMNLGKESSLEDILGATSFLQEVKRGAGVMKSDAAIDKALSSAVSTQKLSTVYTNAAGQSFTDEAAALASTSLNDTTRINSQEFLGLKILDKMKPKLASNLAAMDDSAAFQSGYHAVIDADTKQLRFLDTPENIAVKTKESVFAGISTDYSKKFLLLRGEGAGTISDSSPQTLRLADYLKPGEELKYYPGKLASVQVGRLQYVQQSVGTPIDLAAMRLPSVQSRYIYAAESAPLKIGVEIHQSDIPFLEKAYHQNLQDFKIIDAGGNKFTATGDDLLSLIAKEKSDLAIRIKGESTAEISERTNVPVDYLEGRSTNPNLKNNLFMWQKEILDAGPKSKPYLEPSYAQLGYRTASFDMLGNKLDALVTTEQRAAMARTYNEQVTANYFQELYKDFPTLKPADVAMTTRYSGGQSFTGFGQGQYFTPESKAELVGRITANATKKAVDAVGDALNAPALKLANDQAAAIETSVILNRARAISDSYIHDAANSKLVLKSKVLFDRQTAKLLAETTDPMEQTAIKSSRVYNPPVTRGGNPIDVEVTILNKTANDALAAHIEQNAKTIAYTNTLRAAKGQSKINIMAGELYAPPPNFKLYPHFALVRDGVSGDMSFIGAYTAKDLKKLGDLVPGNLEVLYKEDTAAWHKALGDYKWTETITDSSTDVALKREGILNYYFPKTDPVKIATDLVDWHKEQAVQLTRNMVGLKYLEPIDMLQTLGKQYTAAATSVARTSAKTVTESVNDPYTDMIKTMLNISKAGDYRAWTGVQNTLDAYVSRTFGAVAKLMTAAKSPVEMDGINDALIKSGYRGPLYGADTIIAANHDAPQGVLSSFVRKANMLASNFMIRLDAMQALNNAVSTNVLLSSEMNYLIKQIQMHPNAAAQYDALMKTTVPGTQLTLNTPAKLLARQYGKFFADLNSADSPIITRYQQLGIIPNIKTALTENFDALAVRQSMTQTDIKRLDSVFYSLKGIGDKAMAKGELWTANTHSEMMGRFAAAGLADDITNIAVQNGILSPSEALVAVNSFVNKVHGSTLASQRPILFQGAVGQAISLFQSYQFNLMQQLFKYIGDGNTKAALTLMGMQTSIYGVQGIPAFQAMNNYIIGTAAGNPTHKDIYSETYNTVGKQAGDWLLYGTASNILGLNLYSRGDINPRQVSIIPVAPADIPFVSLSAKLVSNAYATIAKTVGGAPAGAALLQGLEHIGINRPLSGLASAIQGFTTTGTGSLLSITRSEDISGGTDWHLLANTGRILGAKPLDEAIILDANYRYTAYRAKEIDMVKKLGAIVQTKMLSGQEITEPELLNFMSRYQAAGGKQDRFNQQMINWQKNTTESVVNKLAYNLNTGAGKYLQRVMAGSTGMPDYTGIGGQ